MNHLLNVMNLPREDFWDKLQLRYGMTPLALTTDRNECGQRFMVDHGLSCTKGGLVMERHRNSAKEWGELGDQGMTTRAIC